MKLKKKILIVYCAIIFFLGFALYYNTPYYISKYAWKNNGGARISDVLIFKDKGSYTIDWPFIYKKNQKKGFLMFCFNKKMWIYSFQQNEDSHIGEYYKFISYKDL